MSTLNQLIRLTDMRNQAALIVVICSSVWIVSSLVDLPYLPAAFEGVNGWFAVAVLLCAAASLCLHSGMLSVRSVIEAWATASAVVASILFSITLADPVRLVHPVDPVACVVVILLDFALYADCEKVVTVGSTLTRFCLVITALEILCDAAGFSGNPIWKSAFMGSPAAVVLFLLSVSMLPAADMKFKRVMGSGKLSGQFVRVFTLVSVSVAIAILGLREVCRNAGMHEVMAFCVLPIICLQLAAVYILLNWSARNELRGQATHKRRVALLKHAIQMRMLYDHSPAAFLEIANDRIVAVNAVALSWLGYRKCDVIGKPIASLLHADCLKCFRRHVSLIESRGWIQAVQLSFITTDGSLLPADVALGPSGIPGSDGLLLIVRQPEAIIGKRITAFESIEKQFRFLMSVTEEYMMVQLDSSGLILNWPKAAIRFFGIESDEAIGMPLSHLLGATNKEAGDVQRIFKSAAENGCCQDDCILNSRRYSQLRARLFIQRRNNHMGEAIGFELIIKLLSRVAQSGNKQHSNLSLLSEIKDNCERVEVQTFFKVRASECLAKLSHAITEQNVVDAEKFSRQLHRLLDCYGCSSVCDFYSQMESHVSNRDWRGANLVFTAVRAAIEEIYKAGDLTVAK